MKSLTVSVAIVASSIMTLAATTVLAGGSPTKETLLAQSGFRLMTVTTPRQREQIESLPEGQVHAITYQQKLFYVYRTMTRDRIYVGRQQQFDAYKQELAKAENTARVQQEMQTRPDMVEETAGPQHIRIQEFDGFGPMNSFGDE